MTETEDRTKADVSFVDDVLSNVLRDPAYAKIALPVLDPKLMPTPAHEWVVGFLRDTWDAHKELPDAKLAAIAASSLKVEESANAKLLWIKLESHTARAPKAALAEVQKFVHQSALELQWEQVGVLMQANKHEEAEALMAKAVKRVDTMSDVEISRWMEEFEKRQERRLYERDNPDSSLYVKTGWLGLDRHLNGGLGVGAGQAGGILAITNMGKSVVATNFGFVGATNSHPTVHISSEMKAAEVDIRYDSRFTGVAADKFPHYKFSDEELKRIDAIVKAKRKKYEKMLRIIAMPIEGMTKAKVIEAVMQCREEMEGLELIVFDSPDHLRSGRPTFGKEGFRLEQASNYWWFISFCQELNCAGWATVQAGSQAAGGIATNEDISESYDKARILSFIMSLNAASKTDRSTPKHDVTADEWDGGEEISVSNAGLRGFLDKNRHGPAKIDIPLHAELDKMLITDGDVANSWGKSKPTKTYKLGAK